MNTSPIPATVAARIVALRRKIHAHPELSNQELNTQRLIVEELNVAGITHAQPIAVTGLMVDLEGNQDGRTLILRADMDALPINEQRPDLSFCSKVDGVMHACGHDAHTAMLLGATVVLNDLRDRFRGTVRCIFQPAEEAEPLGGREVVRSGALDDADAAIALHISPELQAGTIGLRDGPLLAGGMEFTLTVHGESAHVAKPHQGVDAIYVAAAIVQGLQSVVSRQVDPLEPFVLGIGKIHGGSAKNIIAAQTTIEGTVRMLSEDLRTRIPKMILDTATSIAASHGAKVTLEVSPGEPVLENAPEVNAVIRGAAHTLVGESRVAELSSGSMGSEDFAFYTATIPGAMFRLGVCAPDDDVPRPLHHPQMNVDESALEVGAAVLVESALRFLSVETGTNRSQCA